MQKGGEKMIYKKIAISIVSGALLLGSLATSAFADDTHHTQSNSSTSINVGQGSSNNNWLAKYQSRLITFLNDDQEVPGPGDSDGFGFVKIKVHPEQEKLCVNLRVYGIEPATAAHIHEAPAGQAGPVVVNLPTPNAKGHANGCVTVAKDELEEILGNPSHYYVNVHNSVYPAGAVRGQL